MTGLKRSEKENNMPASPISREVVRLVLGYIIMSTRDDYRTESRNRTMTRFYAGKSHMLLYALKADIGNGKMIYTHPSQGLTPRTVPMLD